MRGLIFFLPFLLSFTNFSYLYSEAWGHRVRHDLATEQHTLSSTLQLHVLGIRKSVQFSSVPQPCLTLCDPMDCSTPGFLSITNSQSLLKLMSIASVMPSSHLFLCRSFFSHLQTFPAIRVFSNESVLHISWSKYWSFSFSISPSNEYLELISFRMDWLDLLAVQRR